MNVSRNLPGSHLAADTPYRKLIEVLSKKYPSLQYPDPNRLYGIDRSVKSRVTYFQFVSDCSAVADSVEFQDAESIQSHVEAIRKLPNADSFRELYIMEGFDPEYVAVLGEGLQVDPNVFARHERTGQWQYNHEGRESAVLPSLLNSSRSFTLEYRELLYLDPNNNFNFHCVNAKTAENERNISQVNIDNNWTRVGIVQRKASYWARKRNEEAWQGLVILDPPVHNARIWKSERDWRLIPLPNIPYQGGYADIIPFTNLEDALKTKGPPRTSMYDDLCYYFEHHTKELRLSCHPRSATAFLEKIVAAHHLRLLEYNRGIFDHFEKRLFDLRGEHAGSEVDKWEKSMWNDLFLFSRRCKFEFETIESAKIQLQSDEEIEETDGKTKKADYVYLHQQCERLKSKTETLITAALSLASLVDTKTTLKESQRNLKESKSVFRLTIVGSIFLPLSLTASLFSMSPEYQPGSSRFWVYWVVAIAMICAILPPVLLHHAARSGSRAQITGPWKFQLKPLEVETIRF